MKKVVIGIISKKRDTGEEEFLLVSSKKNFGEFSGYYYPPGGHVENNESIEDALTRELKEELSLDVIPLHELAATPGDVEDQMTYWWLCKIKNGDIKINKNEIADAAYFTALEMKEIKIWPATKNFFNVHIFKNKTLLP